MNKRGFLEKLMDIIIAVFILIIAFAFFIFVAKNQGQTEEAAYEKSMRNILASQALTQELRDRREDGLLAEQIDPLNNKDETEQFFLSLYSHYQHDWRVNIHYEEEGEEELLKIGSGKKNLYMNVVTTIHLPRMTGPAITIELLHQYYKSKQLPSASPLVPQGYESYEAP